MVKGRGKVEETARKLKEMTEALGPGRASERDYGWGLFHREMMQVGK